MFLNATMLAGIAGAMLPLVLHLLNRARYRRVEWGAMMFLGDAHVHPHRSSRWRELVLLAMRMGLVAMLAIALARPVLGPTAGEPQNDPRCMVILLDHSASMGIDDNGPRRLDAAQRAAVRTLLNLKPGDEAAVIGTPGFGGPGPRLTTDLNFLAQRVNASNVSTDPADIATGMAIAARFFEQSHALNKQLVVISDRQAISWQNVNSVFATTWRRMVRDSEGRVPKFTLITVGGNDAANVAIESVQIVNPPVVKDAVTEVEVMVHNFDTVPNVGLPLTLSAGFAELYHTTLNLAPAARQTVRCAVKFPESGSVLLETLLGAAGMSSDDRMETAVDVTDAIDVLVISGDQRDDSAGPFSSEGDFIRLALAPFAAAGQTGPDPANVQVVSADSWPELDRTKHRVVILANVARLSMRQARQLEQFVYGGGGLLIAPGNLTRVDDYNRQLWRDGAGVLPAELSPPVAADGSQATTLSGLELSHSMFRFLQGREEPLPSVTVGRYFPARAAEPLGRVLGRYASGNPFMIEGSYGRGRVLLVTTSLDADWSTLPLSNFYLPMLQSAVRYLAAGLAPKRNLAPGEPIVATIQTTTEPDVNIDGPGVGGNARPEQLRTSDGYEIRYSNTSRPGQYKLRISADGNVQTLDFVVRAPRDESDVTCLSDKQWTALREMLGFERIEAEPRAIAEATAVTSQRRELWLLLLPAVIVLGLLEMVLARFWTSDGGQE